MPINNIMLRNLLKVFLLNPKARRRFLIGDIKAENDAAIGGKDERGPGFYTKFWSDAKNHVFDGVNLEEITSQRVIENRRRKNIYPVLCSGFILWWDERRRWTNRPFLRGATYTSNFKFDKINSSVKVENILSVRDGEGAERLIYPYWFRDPELSEFSARLGIWLLSRSLSSVPIENIRILDIARGQTYSVDRNPLSGNEEGEFLRMYEALLAERAILKEELG